MSTPFDRLIICHPLRAVYGAVPKAGCSTTKAYLRRVMGLPPVSLRDLHDRRRNGFAYPASVGREELIHILFGRKAGYFKFTIGRNPFARLVSAYVDLVQARGGEPPRGGAAVEELRLRYANARDLRPSEVPALDFRQFLEAVEMTPEREQNQHWQPQVVVACTNLIAYDRVFQLEKMVAWRDELAGALGVTELIAGQVNAMTYDRDLSSYYTPETLAIVQRVYARDFARFRYDPAVLPEG